MYFQRTETAKEVLKNAEEVTEVAWWSINNLWEALLERLPYILAAILVVVIFWFLSRFVRWAFTITSKRTRMDARLRILFSRMIAAFLVTLGVFTGLTIIIPSLDFTNILAGLGFTSVVVGFAAKDILNNFLSGIFILWQRPFMIGDYVFIDKNEGIVEFIGVRATSLRMDDGELIIIPNGEMYSNPLTIRGAGTKRRMQVYLNIGFHEDVEAAKSIALERLRMLEGVVKEPKPSVYVTDIRSEGVKMSITFWLDTKMNSPLKVFDEAAIAVMNGMRSAGIELYPPDSMIVRQDGNEG